MLVGFYLFGDEYCVLCGLNILKVFVFIVMEKFGFLIKRLKVWIGFDMVVEKGLFEI